MIFINNFTINSDNTALVVQVEVDAGETVSSALLWTNETFKDYSKAIDITSYLEQVDNTEDFIIPASVLEQEILKGIYFIEFEATGNSEDNCTNCSNGLGVATSPYYLKDCLLSKVREYKVCDGINKCNEILLSSILNISVLLDSFCTSLQFGYYEEAIDIFNTLNKLCSACNGCKDFLNPNFRTGLNYGILDDTLILV